jgi:hypothetical protein
MTNHARHLAVAGLLAATLVLTGCPPAQRAAVCPGPPLPEAELIALNNANAQKVPSLRANADVEISFRHEDKVRTERLRDGLLLLLKDREHPDAVPSFLLRAVMVSEPYFGAGVDAAAGEYYFWLDPPRGEAAARWGRLDDLHRAGYESMPVDPVDLLSVLAVLPWPLRDPDRPVLSLPKDDPCLYDLLFFGRAGEEGGVQLRRQVWLDRTVVPPRPWRVWVFDSAGRVTVDATLADYRKIDVPSLPADERPVMPTDILLRYPQEQDILSLRVRLSNMTIGGESSPVRAAMFQRRNVIPARIEDQRPMGPLKDSPIGERLEATRPAAGETAP